MGSGCSKYTRIAPASTKDTHPNKEVRSVWLLSSSDEKLLQQTMDQLSEKIKPAIIKKNVDSCVSYVRSLSCYNVILITSSQFTSEIFPKICSLRQVVSFISFYPCNNESSL